MTLEEAFAAWRLENIRLTGWALEAFKAGWEARGAEAPSPRIYGVDLADGTARIVVLEKLADGRWKLVDDAPAIVTGYCNRPGGCTCIDKPNVAVQRQHCLCWQRESI